MRWTRERAIRAGGLLTASLAAALSCSIERERGGATGVHPEGWSDTASAAFHGGFLREHAYPLADCRACHGDDYGGGAVQSSCVTAGCHSEGVESCGTCHGDGPTGLPATGAHAAHATLCADCHAVPESAREGQHPDGTVQVRFAGLAATPGAAAAFDAEAATCAVYCHAPAVPTWSEPAAPLGCDGCHGAPPASHARFALSAAADACGDCHPAPPDARHLDGVLDVAVTGCTGCHGKGDLGAPPPDLAGSSDPKSPGAGAHARHLDATLPDRIGKVARCEACHVVPEGTLDEGHLDEAAPADVAIGFGGAYDAASHTCVAGCHWDAQPGPAWTDDSGGARACDACHGFPPLKTRVGTAHPPGPGDLAVCLGCHAFDPLRHVDGQVDFKP